MTSDVAQKNLESDVAVIPITPLGCVLELTKQKPTVCDVNQIRVVLYGDDKTPANKNFIPCELMTIARWGCIDYVDGDPDLFNKEGLTDNDAISKSIERRQRLFSISNSDGRIVKLRKVNKPKLEKAQLRNDNRYFARVRSEYGLDRLDLKRQKIIFMQEGIVVQ